MDENGIERSSTRVEASLPEAWAALREKAIRAWDEAGKQPDETLADDEVEERAERETGTRAAAAPRSRPFRV